jgi:hypothetical protein
MVSGRQHVQTQSQQLLGNRGSEPESAGGVFRIGDSQVDAIGLFDVLQVIGHDVPPRRGENVADKQYIHAFIRFRRDVRRHEAVRGAAEAPVGEQRHAVAETRADIALVTSSISRIPGPPRGPS